MPIGHCDPIINELHQKTKEPCPECSGELNLRFYLYKLVEITCDDCGHVTEEHYLDDVNEAAVHY